MRLCFGQRQTQLLIVSILARSGRGGRLFVFGFELFLCFELSDYPFGADDVGMLFGINQAQLIQVFLQTLNTGIQFRIAGNRPGIVFPGVSIGKLALELIAARLGFAQCERRFVDVFLRLAQFGEIVTALARHYAQVLLLKILELVFGID